MKRLLVTVMGVTVLLSLLAAAQSSSSLSKHRLTVLNKPEHGLSLEAYSASSATMFSQIFRRGEFARLEPFSLVLSNFSGKAIFGLTLRWTVTDGSGAKEILDYSTDSFFLVHRSVLDDGAHLLVMPGALVPEGDGRQGFIGPGPDTLEMLANKFDNSSLATVSVDTVIFEDGAVVGPDVSDTLAKIIARKEAVDQVLGALRQASGRNEDLKLVMGELARHHPQGPKDYVGQWQDRIVRRLQQAPALTVELDALSKIPNPPTASTRGSFSPQAPIKAGPRLVTWSCSPPSCISEFIGYSGIVQVDINGICNNGHRPHAHGQVAAYCTLPVTLVASAYPEIFTYGYDRVNGEARAYNYFGVEYWFMYNENGCDGYYYFFADPPTRC